MRTTLTLDDDVAALLARVRKARKASLKAVVNEALRQGLKQMTIPAQPRKSYRTPAVSLGRCLVGSLDDVAEILSVAEGDAFR
jgi:Ribbon-helix-helix protein, copG family